VDGLRLLELRRLPVDDDLGGVLHKPGPAKALRHLDDGELSLLGQIDDVGRDVLDEPGGLDKERRGTRHHHPAAELALTVQVTFEGEHGGQHHLAARQPVGDVGDFTHGH
jgi:hypothetical protein